MRPASISFLLIIATCLSSNARAQTGSATNNTMCPPAGTVIQVKSQSGGTAITSKGADPSDKTLCIQLLTGPGAGAYHDKDVKAFFGWYTQFSLTAGQEEKIRAAFGPLLTGQAERAQFDLTQTAEGRHWVWTNRQTWQRVGQANLTINGRTYSTIRFRFHEKGVKGSNRDQVTDTWYDPETHIWMKTQRQSPGGPNKGYSEVVSIKFP